MKFNILTIFPKIFDSYFQESILKKAQEKKLIKIETHNPRDFSKDKHKKVDDTPYGGGAGMVMQVEPIWRCVQNIKNDLKKREDKKLRTILFSAKGKSYTQADARRLAKYDNLILICGRYEGVDERVAKYVVDEEISIGDYVLTGGEIPAMILVDSVSRLIPGVLGNPESLSEESFSNLQSKTGSSQTEKPKLYPRKPTLEYPQYTKPEKFNNWEVPKILLSGNHKKIEEWRKNKAK